MKDRVLNYGVVNRSEIRRPCITVTIEEDQASIEDIVRACWDALRGLGFGEKTISAWMPKPE